MTAVGGRLAPLARWVVRRRRLVAAAWAVAAVALLPLAGGVERRLQVSARVDGSESARVERTLVERFASPFARYAVLVLRGVPAPNTPDGALVLRRAVDAAARVPGVTRTFSYRDAPDTLFLARRGAPADAATTYVIVGLDAARGPADAFVAPLRAATAPLADSLRATYPGAALDWTGEVALNFDLRRASAADAARAERRVLPLTLALLVVAFGAVVAALLPVASGALAIALALGAAALAARVWPLSILLQNVVSMLGLGLGIDYALLLVSRFRESLARGLAPDDAAADAAEHAGHSILLSGLAVAIGFAALLAAPLSELRSIAAGGLLVVVASVLLATTLLPGLLAWLGPRVDAGRVLRRRTARTARGDGGGPGLWRRWGAWVAVHPWRVLLATGVPLAALVAQAWRLETGLPRGDWLPPAMESARGVHALAAAGRSGVVQTVRVVVELPPPVSALSDSGWRAVARVDSALAADPRVARTRSLPAILPGGAALVPLVPADVRAGFVSRDERAALVELVPREGATPAELSALVRAVRAADAACLTGVAGARLSVGGLPAFNADYEQAIASCTPLVVALVVGGTFVVLLVGFRSVLVPLKAVALNLVSVGAAFGAVTLVFQDGHGARLVGLAAPLDGTFPAVPLIVFCIVFGLSMDYEVFLVSRVAEARRGGAGEREALAEGMARTGGVITSAAAIMMVVFAAFTLGDFVLMKILGFALAVAVFLDATIVRAALGPALLALAGRWNWWPGDDHALATTTAAGERRRRGFPRRVLLALAERIRASGFE